MSINNFGSILSTPPEDAAQADAIAESAAMAVTRAALLGKTSTVCGVVMRPFTMCDYVLLTDAGCGMVTGMIVVEKLAYDICLFLYLMQASKEIESAIEESVLPKDELRKLVMLFSASLQLGSLTSMAQEVKAYLSKARETQVEPGIEKEKGSASKKKPR